MPDAPKEMAARAEHFMKVVSQLGTQVDIFITQVDPDALGSAVAIGHLLEQKKGELSARIFYGGAIGHPQNRAMINRYNLTAKMTPIDAFDQAEAAPAVLVDSSLGEDNRMPTGLKIDPVIVIDHHRGTDLVEAEGRFLWIEDVGAASTLVTELYQALGEPLNARLATLLALGIYTDTKALVTASERDRLAYGYLSTFLQPEELKRFIDYPLPKSHFQHLAQALNHYEHRGARLVVSLGTIPAEEGDDLSTIADYFLRMDGVSLVVVWGIIGHVVRISARNRNLSAPLDVFLKKRFGPSSGAKLAPDGTGEGGARLGLDLGIWMSEGTRPEVEAMVGRRVRELIFQDDL